MPATNVETLANPRDSLPNVYTNITAREIDFVTRFGKNWDALRKILGIMRPIRKAPGTQLVTYSASIVLESGNVGPGNVIPYSKSTVSKAGMADLTLEKYAKAVTIEDVNQYGAQIAIEKTDEAFLNELQMGVLTRFFDFLKTGTLVDAYTTFQMALSMARGKVLDKFAKMRRTVTNVVGFCNVLDAYAYIGAADITVQTAFGMTYIENFLGYSTLFLLSDPDIPRGMVIALPVENIDLYYVDPGDSEFARLGLNYTVQGETNLIGFHANGNYSTAVGESFALMGMALWAEYLDGIAIVYLGTQTKVTNAETITADSVDTKLYKTANSPVISVQELKDGSTALVEGTDYTVEKNGVRLKNTPSGTVTIKYTYVAQA